MATTWRGGEVVDLDAERGGGHEAVGGAAEPSIAIPATSCGVVVEVVDILLRSRYRAGESDADMIVLDDFCQVNLSPDRGSAGPGAVGPAAAPNDPNPGFRD
jgi:hypothetical protein